MRNDPLFAFVKECVKPGKDTVPARVMSSMCQEYAIAAHGQTRLSASTIHAALQKVVREVLPTSKLQTEGGVRNVIGYENLALTDLGMAYWQKVRDKQVAGLEGMTSPYGKRV